jgi:hypothetical protein
MPVKFETWRVNVSNVTIIVGGIVVSAACAGYIWNDTLRDIKARQVEQAIAQQVPDLSRGVPL